MELKVKIFLSFVEIIGNIISFPLRIFNSNQGKYDFKEVRKFFPQARRARRCGCFYRRSEGNQECISRCRNKIGYRVLDKRYCKTKGRWETGANPAISGIGMGIGKILMKKVAKYDYYFFLIRAHLCRFVVVNICYQLRLHEVKCEVG